MSMRSELRTILDLNGTGAIAAPTVVEMAKDATSFPALHQHLWQTPEATLAQEARIARAHRLLITMQITIADTGDVTRMMIHTRGTPGYQTIDALARTPDLAALKLQQLIEDIARARARLRAFRGALPDELAGEIDTALEAAERRATVAVTPAQSIAAA